jgi:N-dimethylarginine dimethylaminohydrolase
VLCHQLARSGADVVHFPAFGELTLDAVYAHDASLATDYGLIAMNLGKSSRSAESALHRSFCQSLGLPVLGAISHPGTTEAGDMIWLDSKTLLIGSGYRTNRPGIEQMRNLLLPHSVTVLAASLPHGSGPDGCLHLMSLISLLDEATAVVDLPWLSVETVELLRTRGYHLIEIDYRERESLASNVLALGAKRVLALDENVRTNEILRRAGFDVWTFPGSELCINGGGGPTCLTRPWSRA